MTDLLERLREDARGGLAYHELSDEAADEIERLRAALNDMVEISQRNSEPGLMLIAIRKCAEHALRPLSASQNGAQMTVTDAQVEALCAEIGRRAGIWLEDDVARAALAAAQAGGKWPTEDEVVALLRDRVQNHLNFIPSTVSFSYAQIQDLAREVIALFNGAAAGIAAAQAMVIKVHSSEAAAFPTSSYAPGKDC